jgi:hypothetical protein
MIDGRVVVVKKVYGEETLHGRCGVGILDEGGVVAERVHSKEHEIK